MKKLLILFLLSTSFGAIQLYGAAAMDVDEGGTAYNVELESFVADAAQAEMGDGGEGGSEQVVWWRRFAGYTKERIPHFCKNYAQAFESQYPEQIEILKRKYPQFYAILNDPFVDLRRLLQLNNGELVFELGNDIDGCHDDISLPLFERSSILGFAAFVGNYWLVEELLEYFISKGILEKYTKNCSESALFHAARNAHVDTVRLLLEKGAEFFILRREFEDDSDLVDFPFHRALYSASVYVDDYCYSLLKCFEEKLMERSAKDRSLFLNDDSHKRPDNDNVFNLLYTSCGLKPKQEFIKTIALLLKMGASPDGGRHDGTLPPLFCVVSNGHVRSVELLLQYGADVSVEIDERDKRGKRRKVSIFEIAGRLQDEDKRCKILRMLAQAQQKTRDNEGGSEAPKAKRQRLR